MIFGIAVDIYFLISAGATIAPTVNLSLAYGSVALGVWTFIMNLMATCTDPGVIDQKQDSHSQEATMRSMSLNEDELKAFCENE